MLRKLCFIITESGDLLAKGLAGAACVVLVGWVLTMTIGIIGRAFLDWSWMFLEEYTRYFTLVCKGLGIPYAAVAGTNITVRVVVARLHKPVTTILKYVAGCIYIYWAVVLTQKMSTWLIEALRIGSTSLDTGTPEWIPNLALVVGFGTLAIVTLGQFLNLVLPVHKEKVGRP